MASPFAKLYAVGTDPRTPASQRKLSPVGAALLKQSGLNPDPRVQEADGIDKSSINSPTRQTHFKLPDGMLKPITSPSGARYLLKNSGWRHPRDPNTNEPVILNENGEAESIYAKAPQIKKDGKIYAAPAGYEKKEIGIDPDFNPNAMTKEQEKANLAKQKEDEKEAKAQEDYSKAVLERDVSQIITDSEVKSLETAAAEKKAKLAESEITDKRTMAKEVLVKAEKDAEDRKVGSAEALAQAQDEYNAARKSEEAAKAATRAIEAQQIDQDLANAKSKETLKAYENAVKLENTGRRQSLTMPTPPRASQPTAGETAPSTTPISLLPTGRGMDKAIAASKSPDIQIDMPEPAFLTGSPRTDIPPAPSIAGGPLPWNKVASRSLIIQADPNFGDEPIEPGTDLAKEYEFSAPDANGIRTGTSAEARPSKARGKKMGEGMTEDTPPEWTSNSALTAQANARDTGTDVIHTSPDISVELPASKLDAEGALKVGGKQIGVVRRTMLGLPEVELSPSAFGQTASPSYRSKDPFSGAPEYAAASASFTEQNGLDSATKWRSQRWSQEQVSELIENWKGSGDADRRKLMDNDLLKDMEGEMPDAGQLYRQGRISLQQARQLDQAVYGRSQKLPDHAESFAAWKGGDTPAAVKLREIESAGATAYSDRELTAARQRVLTEWEGEYRKRHGKQPDFDPNALVAARKAIAGTQNTGLQEFIAGAEDIGSSVIGSSAGILQRAAKQLMNSGFGQAAIKQAIEQAPAIPMETQRAVIEKKAKGLELTQDEKAIDYRIEWAGGKNVSDAALAIMQTPSEAEFEMTKLSSDIKALTSKWREADEDPRNVMVSTPDAAADAMQAGERVFGSQAQKDKAVAEYLDKREKGQGNVLADIDLLKEHIDNNTLTPSLVKTIGERIKAKGFANTNGKALAKLNQHLTPEELLASGKADRFDITQNTAAGALLAAYEETRDEGYIELLKGLAYTTDAREDVVEKAARFATMNGYIQPSDSWGSFNLTRRGIQVDPKEFLIEAAGSVTSLGITKALNPATRIFKAAGKAGTAATTIQKAMSRADSVLNMIQNSKAVAAVKGIGESYAKAGIKVNAPAMNALISKAKEIPLQSAGQYAQGATAAMFEEGRDASEINKQAMLEAAGGGMMAMMNIAPIAALSAAERMKANASQQQASKKWADDWNSRHPEQPITAADAMSINNLIDHRDRSDAVSRIKAAIEVIDAQEGPPTQDQEQALTQAIYDAQSIERVAIQTHQELEGIGDKRMKAFVKAGLRTLTGQPLTSEDQKALGAVNANGEPLMTSANGGIVFTDAGLAEVSQAAPGIRQRYFPESQEAQELQATQTPNDNQANTTPAGGKVAEQKPASANEPGPLQEAAQNQPVDQTIATDGKAPLSNVDDKASAAATSPTNDLPEPTEAQKKAGNYKVGKINVSGLGISIENPVGSIRKGRDEDGKAWETQMSAHYGYMRNTVGADGDHIDVFVKPGTTEDFDGMAFVIPQRKPNGKFDEHKVMIGYANVDEAKKAYKAHYAKGWQGYRPAMPVPMSELASMVKSGKLKKPNQRQRTNDKPNTINNTGSGGDGAISTAESGEGASVRRGVPNAPTPASENNASAQGSGKTTDVGGGVPTPVQGVENGDTTNRAGASAGRGEGAEVSGDNATSDAPSGEEPASVQVQGNWSIRTTKGRKLTIPASAATDSEQAKQALAAQLGGQRGELLVLDSLQAPAVEQTIAQRIYDEVAKVATRTPARDKQLVMHLGRLILAAVRKHEKMLGIAFADIKIVSGKVEGGGMYVQGNTLHISPATLIRSMMLFKPAYIETFVDTGFFHEALHPIIEMNVSAEEAAMFWDELKPEAQEAFITSYEQDNPGSLVSSSTQKGYEYLRALVERKYNAHTSEELFIHAGVSAKIVAAIKKVVEFLRDLQSSLKEGGDYNLVKDIADKAEMAFLDSGIATGSVDAQRNTKAEKAKAEPIGSSARARSMINEEFGDMAKALGIDITPNYAGSSARYVISEDGKRRGGYIEINPVKIANWSPGQMKEAMREEMVHAIEDRGLIAELMKSGYKMSDDYIQSGQYHIDFFNGVYDMMSPEQIAYVKDIYTSHGNREYVIGSEFRRMLLTNEHYKGLTEAAFAGKNAKGRKAIEAIAGLLKIAVKYLRALATTNTPAGKQAARIYEESRKALQKLDPRGEAQVLAMAAPEVEIGHFDKEMSAARDMLSNLWDGRSGELVSESDGGFRNGGTDYRVIDLDLNDSGRPTHRAWFNASDNGGTNIDRLVVITKQSMAAPESKPLAMAGPKVPDTSFFEGQGQLPKARWSRKISATPLMAQPRSVDGRKMTPREQRLWDEAQKSFNESLAAEKARLQLMAGPLAGLPSKVKIPGMGEREFGPYQPARDTAVAYMKEAGLKYDPPRTYSKVDRSRAERIAAAFDAMKHDPQDPKVAAAYKALIAETVAQWEAIKKTGLKVSPMKKGMADPYAASPRLAQVDVEENNHLWFYPTDFGFGNDVTGFDPKDNPLFEFTGEVINGHKMRANDVFRIVHDYFGHFKEGVGFRADGEENAWRQHAAMFSDLARGALTTETRGQNSWLNFGPYGEKNRTARTEDTVFADQKIGLMPEWTWREGLADPVSGGAAFAKFFNETQTTKDGGATFKDAKEILQRPLEGHESELQSYLKFGSNFQKHIMASIPGFLDARIRVMRGMAEAAVVLGHKGKEVAMLDITSSEGYFTKAWAEQAQARGVNATADALDALPAFEDGFKATPQVKGVRYLLEAWGESFVDPTTEKLIPQFKPNKKYGIVHEGMGFQFFTPTRDAEIAEVKSMMSPGGLFVTLEKLKNEDYKAREVLKDEYKAQFFSKKQMDDKAATVLNKSDENAVGMSDYQFDRLAYEALLKKHFRNVTQIYSSGNFAGYYATDSDVVMRAALDNTGDTTTKFNEEATPRRIAGVQPMAAPMSKPYAESAIRDLGKLKLEEEGGDTLNLDGSKYTGGGVAIPVLSKNVDDYRKMTTDDIGKFINPENIEYVSAGGSVLKAGIYKFPNSTKASIDLNIIAPREKRDEGVKIAGELGQESAFDLDSFENIKTGQDGMNPRKPTVEEVRDIAQRLSMAAPQPDGELALGKRASASFLRQKNVKRVIDKTAAAHPEAKLVDYIKDGSLYRLDEKGLPQAHPEEYNLPESRLAKESMKGLRGEARLRAYERALADKLKGFYDRIKTQPDVMAGKEWYRVARTKLVNVFGDDTMLFAQLLAATSARTPVQQNFEQALDAYNGIYDGRFDGVTERYLSAMQSMEAGELQFRKSIGNNKMGDTVTPKTFREWLDIEGIMPRRENGKKYNANSIQVLNVIAGVWREKLGGPKTAQFSDNLSGASLEATVDVWAARTLHRLSNEQEGARWRILPEAETGVNNEDFAIGQAAFRIAASELGMNPDDLQGVLWFAEKRHWAARGWTRAAGSELSDFSSLLDFVTDEGGRKVLRMNTAQGMLGLDDTETNTPNRKPQTRRLRASEAGATRLDSRGDGNAAPTGAIAGRVSGGRGAERVAAEEQQSLFMAAPSQEQIEDILPGAEYINPRDAFYESIKGPVIIGAFHGTTHDFSRFTNDRGEPGNNFGKAIYATTSIDDVNANYAGVGPDLTNRISEERERLLDEGKTKSWATRLAKKKLIGHGGAIVPLWIPSRNPLILDKAEGDTKIQLRVDRAEYHEDAIREVMSDRGMTREEAEDSEYLYDEIDRLAEGEDNIDKLKGIVDSFGGTYWGKLVDDIGYDNETISASDLEEILRTSEGTIYAKDDDGNMVNGELVRQVFMDALGYDAIIDRNVADKFNSMKGMNAAVHIIVDADGPNRPVSALSPTHQFMAAPSPTAERAIKDGFTEGPFVHRTFAEFSEFDLNAPKRNRKSDIPAVYLSNPGDNYYRGKKITVYVNPGEKGLKDITFALNQRAVENEGVDGAQTFNESKMELVTEALDEGYTGTKYNGSSYFDNASEIIVFDPKNTTIIQQPQSMAGPSSDPQRANFVEPGFYSELQRTIANKMPNAMKVIPASVIPGRKTSERTITGKDGKVIKVIKATNEPDRTVAAKGIGEQMSAMLLNADVTPDELKWSGLLTWLDGRESVTKAEVEQYLRDEGQVRFVETSLSDMKGFSIRENRDETEYQGRSMVDVVDPLNGFVRFTGTPSEARNWIDEENGARGSTPKYSEHVLPGGENYREVVLAMPEKIPANLGYVVEQVNKPGALTDGYWRVVDSRGNEVAAPVPNRLWADLAVEKWGAEDGMKQTNYTSSHFSDVPNYVAHMRLNERTDSTGKSGLFIEELQSDRHQAGRKEGYITKMSPETHEVREVKTSSRSIRPDGWGVFAKGSETTSGVYITESDAISAIERGDTLDVGVPDAPFRQSSAWGLHLFKRALRDAVEGGKEWIGWTVGDTQNERYGLEKHFSEIILQKPFNDDRIYIDGRDKDGRRIVDKIIQPSELADHIGEELAAKFDAMPWTPYRFEQSNGAEVAQDSKRLKGLDLKTGGEGMRGFYDTIMPREIGKYVKQWGGMAQKMEPTFKPMEFATQKEAERWITKNAGRNDYSIEPIQGGGFGVWDEQTNNEVGEGSDAIWRVDITPQMRQSIANEGQALFMAGPRSESQEAARESLEAWLALPATAEELRMLREKALSEETGKRTVGDPERAGLLGSGDKENRERDVIIQFRKNHKAPEKVIDWMTEGQGLAESDPDLVTDALLDNFYNGVGYDSPQHVFAAAIIVSQKFKEARQKGDPKLLAEAQALAYADGAARSENARVLRSMVDPHRTPADRMNEFFAKLISTPSDFQRIEIEKAPSPLAKEREIADLRAQIEDLKKQVGNQTQGPKVEQKKKLEKTLEDVSKRKDRKTLVDEYTEARRKAVAAALKREGLTEEDIFVTPEERMAAHNSDPVQEAIAQHPTEHREAINYILRGYSHKDIAAMTKLPVNVVATIHQDFRQKSMRKSLSKWVKGGKTLFDTIQSGLKKAFGMSMAAPVPYGQAKSAGSIIAEAEIERQLNVLVPTAQQVNSGKMVAVIVNGKNGQDVTIKVPFTASDFRSAYRVGRAISTSESNAFDKIYEYWISFGLLSGPETHWANVMGNAGMLALQLFAQKPMEAALNFMIRDPQSATFREYGEMIRGVIPGVRDAFALAALAWDSEADPIGAHYMNETIDLKFDATGNLAKVGTMKGPAIQGTKGRVFRVSTRFLLAMDAFFKAITANIEVGARAYRLGKMAQSKGALGTAKGDLEAFISQQVATPGSESWELAIQTAKELAFQGDNWLTLIAGSLTARNQEAAIANLSKDVVKASAKGDSNEVFNAKLSRSAMMFTGFVMKFIFPFVKTPTNIIRIGARKAGLGSIGLLAIAPYVLAKGVHNIAKGKGFHEGNQSALMVTWLAEQIQAAAMWMYVWSIAEGDDDDNEKPFYIVGSRPYGTAKPGEREAAYAKSGGTQVVMVRNADGTYTPWAYGRYEPFATVLTSVVDTMREIKNAKRLNSLGLPGGSIENVMTNSIASFASQLQDKSFFQGFANVTKAIEKVMNKKGGELVTDTAKGFLQGFVPNIVRQPIRNIDSKVRDSKKADAAYHVLPLGRFAEPLIDFYGRESEKLGTSASRILVREASKPQAFTKAEEMIDRWNLLHPDKKYQPSRLSPADLWIYGPNKERRIITDKKLKTEFEIEVGQEILRRQNELASSIEGFPDDFDNRLTNEARKAREQVRKDFLSKSLERQQKVLK